MEQTPRLNQWVFKEGEDSRKKIHREVRKAIGHESDIFLVRERTSNTTTKEI